MTLRIGSIALRQHRQENFEKRTRQLTRMAADILVIAGFRTGMDGMQLRATLDRLGLVYQTPCDTEPHETALILAARCPFLQIDLPPAIAHHGRNCLHVGIADFRLIACDLMGATDPSSLNTFLFNQAEDLLRDKALVFSRPAGAAGQPPQGPAAELRPVLMGLGYLDAFQLAPRRQVVDMPGEGPAFSVVTTPALAPQLSDCFQADDGTKVSRHAWETAVLRVG